MSLEPRPNARGGRAARRANQRDLEQDRLHARGVIQPLQTASEKAWAEKLNCPICNQAVHPTNWSDHMAKKHPAKEIPLHEAEPGRLPLTAIRIDGGTQPRAQTESDVIDDYAEAMLNGTSFPSVIAFYDGKEYWLADGFHRVEAAKRAGLTDIAADVRQGTQRDAILFSVGANASHGLRRTNADKRRAVERLLRDEEWAKWSDREIARNCAVHHEMVGKLRKELSGGIRQIDDERTVQRNGSTYSMNTGNIGKSDPVRYGQNEDDYQPEVPEVHVEDGEETWEQARLKPPKDGRYSENETEWKVGGRGAKVKTPAGHIGTVAFAAGRFVWVDTINGRKQYDAEKLIKVDDNFVPAPTPSYADLPERQVEFLLDLANGRPIIKNAATRMALRGHGLITTEDDWGAIKLTDQGKLWLGVRDLMPPSPTADQAAANRSALVMAERESDEPIELDKPFNYKRDNQTTRTANEHVAQPFDLCQTPAYALDPMLPFLGWSMPSTVWEPAAGEGQLVEALYDGGWKEAHVIQSDIQTGQNFFDYEPKNWDIIVTNPPFSLKLQWLERCYALGKPFALLVPVDVIGTKTAQALMQAHGFELMLLSDRVDFKMPNKGWNGAGAQFSVLWLCHNLLPEKVMFGDIEAGKKAFKAEIGGLSDVDPE